ncbi:adenylate/guanylate cyclase domain-containing protein [Sinorhizobium terangae]|uniref:Adenylate/guanylate cyclase domain-containing protein n=1 Tax=Sinorhizobium terangae TaxID=110322 RepID=A0A6N7LME4_SINTE|nr:adenylate/guanylate cyclase domain-containing protein [Sinorhizobium terangae]MBB4189380.1 class 3 adenylate cyclase [Sinorhizobium terangae]MQX18940.1 adenylate/guanylate cyclase domain-containing protein [Sinorhizobium terangae]MQX19053.1 adenylate/guanylate cyclase domain-containing protein [Sinorhizobium terangae]WFU49605.1 adenylate/guanylate cyclase domain-containing protein [Sinorhizobium terangae]
MSETRRKLTTIFSADVQDYSRLMGADEEGTLATLKRYRDAMARLIEVHGGRVVNTWGDGLIAEFPSVVEAVRAAVDVQNELAGLNADRPSETQMRFRIGINLGDVIAEGDDLYGDGVNIAARLQATASAGGIVISNTVYDQVRNKVAVSFDFLGQLEVKNIEGGVASYAVRIGNREDGGRDGQPTSDAARSRAPTGTSTASQGSGPAAPAGTWGRRSGAGAARPQAPSETSPAAPRARKFAVFAILAAAVVAINLLTWDGVLWAVWPLLGFAIVYALLWLRRRTDIDRVFGLLALAALIVIAVNLLTFDGTFWAVWPLLGLSIAAALRWVLRRG